MMHLRNFTQSPPREKHGESTEEACREIGEIIHVYEIPWSALEKKRKKIWINEA